MFFCFIALIGHFFSLCACVCLSTCSYLRVRAFVCVAIIELKPIEEVESVDRRGGETPGGPEPQWTTTAMKSARRCEYVIHPLPNSPHHFCHQSSVISSALIHPHLSAIIISVPSFILQLEPFTYISFPLHFLSPLLSFTVNIFFYNSLFIHFASLPSQFIDFSQCLNFYL